MNGGPGGGGPRGRSNTLGARLQEEERGGENEAGGPPPVPSSAAGARTLRFRPLQLLEAEARGARNGPSNRWPFASPPRGGVFRVGLLGRESRESSLPSVALCYSLRLSSSPISVSPVWNLSLPLQVLVRISLGPSLLSDGLFFLCFLLCLFRIPISAGPVHFVPISFHYRTWDFLREKVALRRSPNLILDHEEPDLSPELYSPFN